MELSKKVAYLKGLMEGLKIDDSTNEGKILTIMADILDEMSATVEDIAEEVDETVELVDTLDEDLGEIEDLIVATMIVVVMMTMMMMMTLCTSVCALTVVTQ